VIQLIVNDGTENSAAASVTVTASSTPPVDDWYTVSPDGNTYTVGDSIVELLDSDKFDIDTDFPDKIVFKALGSDPKVYIRLMSNGEVFTGYMDGWNENPTTGSGFAPGTKVSVGTDMVLLIETALTADLTFGGK